MCTNEIRSYWNIIAGEKFVPGNDFAYFLWLLHNVKVTKIGFFFYAVAFNLEINPVLNSSLVLSFLFNDVYHDS